MGRPTTLNEYLFKLVEFWANNGRPEDMWSGVGPLCMMIKKMVSRVWRGDPTAKLAVNTRLNGNVGANFAKAFANQSSSGGDQFQVPLRELWAIAKWPGSSIDIGAQGAIVGGGGTVDTEILNTVTAFFRALSYLLWSDGTGRIAKGNGAWTISGDTITFMNVNSASQFEVNDAVVAIDQGAAIPDAGMPTPRSGVMYVVAVDEDNGTIQLSDTLGGTPSAINATITAIANTDYISKDVYFAGEFAIPDGLFRWNPLTDSEATATTFGVDRSTNTARLSGRRILVSPSEGTYQVVARMGKALLKSRGNRNTAGGVNNYFLFAGLAEVERLQAEAKAQGITFKNGTTGSSIQNLTMGIEYAYASFPGIGQVKIVTDHWLHDPNLPEDQDRTMALVDVSKLSLQTGRSGVGWKQYEDNGGRVKYESGTNNYYAQHGMYGNLFNTNVGHNVMASTRKAA